MITAINKEPVPDKHFDDWVSNLPSLDGKVVAITGTTTGTGFWMAVSAIRKNAKVLINLNRASARVATAMEAFAEEKKSSKSDTEIIQVNCDLMSMEETEKAAAEVNKIATKYTGLHVLATNAGIMAFPDERTSDGYEVQMQVNHISQYLLTKLVMPSFMMAVENGNEVRIAQHSSLARHRSDLEKKYFSKSKAGTLGGNSAEQNFFRYHMTKLANVTFALALDRKLKEKGYDTSKFKSVAAEPGLSVTPLYTNTLAENKGEVGKGLQGTFDFFTSQLEVQSAADGALPLIEAAFGNDVDSGDFFYPKRIGAGIPYKAISKGKLAEGNTKEEPESLNIENQELVWTASEEACGPFFSA